jgi:hypothetical protein
MFRGHVVLQPVCDLATDSDSEAEVLAQVRGSPAGPTRLRPVADKSLQERHLHGREQHQAASASAL